MRKKKKIRILEKLFNAKKSEVGMFKQSNMVVAAASEMQNLQDIGKQLDQMDGNYPIDLE